MKKLGPSQIGMFLLVTMVLVRAFFVTDLESFREGMVRLFSAVPIPTMIGEPDLLVSEDTEPVEISTANYNGRIADNDIANETFAGENDVVAEEGDLNGLNDQDRNSVQLALFTPAPQNDIFAGDDSEPVADIAPLEAQNTITSSMDKFFPRVHLAGSPENF